MELPMIGPATIFFLIVFGSVAITLYCISKNKYKNFIDHKGNPITDKETVERLIDANKQNPLY